MFALRAIREGEQILEYTDEVMSWSRAARRYRRSDETGHTFLFGLGDGRVIDGGSGGNSTRWLNHACDANCIAVEIEGRVFIEVARDIAIGDELFIDYELMIDGPRTGEIEQEYACRCGSGRCRRTMLATATRSPGPCALVPGATWVTWIE
ncbi:SET domain-containing protein [Paraburkholderia sp. BCC1885]|uniref:SET domain-containing protein n=1 Tax=Paraburkholderia sp. BCC1885 TaxID=2562669 RepID=UPI0028CB209C|nr:SET domain-containing protein-lysine N-methyltransferase [Paraburkholderia sp. BCC1885]